MAEAHRGTGRPGGRATRNIVRDDARLLDDVAPMLPTTATEMRTISSSRNPQAGELFPGGRFVVNFPDDLVGTTHGCSFGQSMRTTGSSSILTVTNMRRNFPITRRREYLPMVKVKHPRLALLSSVVVGLSMS